MDIKYRKEIELNDENGEVLCKCSVVLNRAIAVSALEKHPDLADAIFNGTKGLEKEDGKIDFAELIKKGQASKLFVISDEMPLLIREMFPKMLDEGEIEVGNKKEILELVDDLVYDDDFVAGMTDFFMVALTQKGEERKPKRNVTFKMK